MPHDPLNPFDMLADEITQRRESGYLVEDVDPRSLSAAVAYERLDALADAGRVPDWPYQEPDDLPGIQAAAPGFVVGTAPEPGAGKIAGLPDKIHGGWLGRVVGCNLGKPVENGFSFTPSSLRSYLEQAGAYPIDDYIPALDPLPEQFQLHPSWPQTTRGRISGSARDDDIDYTILGLHLLETYGPDYRSADVATEWLQRLPFLLTYTAERATYRNLVYGIEPPATAVHRNPYREWIGAQIRADIHGYLNPGNPATAAGSAYADAALSHVGNGIYGEMWAAALVSAAFTADSARHAVDASVARIPVNSRLAEALRQVLAMHDEGIDWEDARARVETAHGHYGWVHTINNACVVAMGVLWGDGDFGRTIGLTVQGGWDTDSNGATAGSVAGVLVGADAIPAHWTKPLQDKVRSAVLGFDGTSISTLAARTLRLVESWPS